MTKRIGTVTYWWSKENYGQVLQCFALIRFLRNLGYDAFLIRYNGKNSTHAYSLLYFVKIFFKLLLHPKKIYRNLCPTKETSEFIKMHEIQTRTEREHPRYFENFIEKNIPCTSFIYSQKNLVDSPPFADAYVCGSDQIWGGANEVYFLQFTPPKSKRIAYAPSLGGCRPNRTDSKIIKKYLESFAWITTREQQGVDTLKNMSVNNCEKVPDPTLLLVAEDYRTLYTTYTIKKNTKPYMLLYLLGNSIDIDVKYIFEFAQQNNLEVKYVASQGREDDFEKIYPTIENWLYLIDNAEYVITNSFHGTIFCLQYHKNFMTIPISGVLSRMNTRIEELLQEYNLSDRILQNKDKLNDIFNQIDYSVFSQKQNESIAYIKERFKQLI